ncbi:unnamed protein product, partial [Durusdinium trenchii]
MRATQALHSSFSPLASRFGRSSASSDEDELPEAPDMTPWEFSQIDEKRPFPCSYPGCCSFHDADNGYCEEHQWFGFGSRLCRAMNTTRQHLELALLILIQAAAEVESRYLLLLIAFSLAPVACYSIWQSTGIATTSAFLLFACCLLLSIGYTTVRLNRMQELSKKLEVQSESLYAKYLQPNMTTLLGDDVQENPFQRINSLKEHFLEARRHFEKFNRELCLPLRDFLDAQPGFALSHRVQPALKSLPLAQEAVAKRGDPNQVLDLLYCEVTFADFDSLSHAWQFLRTRVEGDDLSGVEIACMYDSFALAHSDLRCSELVCRVDGYLATLRFFVAPLRELQLQVDAVHSLAQQLGLSDARREASHGRPRRHPLLATAMFSMRVIALLAAMYLGGQYFVRYSPSSFRSTVQLFNQVFALKQLEQPGELPEEHRFNWLPSVVLSLPYLALILVLVWDLGSFQAKYRKLKPTQLLYEKYFGVRGRFYSIKVAILQLLTVLLQAFGKLQILGGIVSLSLQQSKLSDVLERCFWTFVGFLCLNSLYPSILFVYPSRKWARLGGAMMDAILDMAYTITYLVFTLLAIYELGLEQEISGNFGDEEAVKFTAKLDPALAFPSDFLGYFAVYYSVAHVCVLRLTDVSLSGKNISNVREGAFESSRRLQRLSLSGNPLYFLPKKIFWPLKDLQLLDLGRMGLQSVESETFEGLSGLKVLSLSQNELQQLPNDLLYPMPALEQLLLGGNIEGRTRIDGNQLEALPADLFQRSPWLRVLDLSENQLRALPAQIFGHTPLLRTLDLGSNDLIELPLDVFEGLSNLQTLDLGGNNWIIELPSGIFAGLSNLRMLDLGRNNLRELPSDVFKGLSNLQMLDLRHNVLRELPSDVFAGLSELQMLYLAWTWLTELPSGIFAALSNLQTLHLQENSLRELPSDVFAGLSKLETLDLGFNWLGELRSD